MLSKFCGPLPTTPDQPCPRAAIHCPCPHAAIHSCSSSWCPPGHRGTAQADQPLLGSTISNARGLLRWASLHLLMKASQCCRAARPCAVLLQCPHSLQKFPLLDCVVLRALSTLSQLALMSWLSSSVHPFKFPCRRFVQWPSISIPPCVTLASSFSPLPHPSLLPRPGEHVTLFLSLHSSLIILCLFRVVLEI